MKSFVQRHQEQILGVLSGFDRLRFRGVLRLLQSEGGTATWLERVGVAVNDFLNFAEGLTKRLCYRHSQADPEGPRQWLNLRKTVADLPRRAELSQASNQRYLEALSNVTAETPLAEITERLCRPVTVDGRRHRGLKPFDVDEVRLLQAVSRDEFLIGGFRNRDVRRALFGETQDPKQRRREAGRVTRKLALLRAHGLIKKIPRTHRYLLTETSVKAIIAILAARQASLSQLAAA